MQLSMQGTSIRTPCTSISLVIGLIKKQRNTEVVISCRTWVQSMVTRGYLAKTFQRRLRTWRRPSGTGQGAYSVSLYQEGGSDSNIWLLPDWYLIAGRKSNTFKHSVIFPADGQSTPEKHTHRTEISPLRSPRAHQELKINIFSKLILI